MTEDPQPKPPPSGILKAVAKLLLGAAILVGLLWWLGPDWSEVGERLVFHWGYLVVGFVGTVLATAFTAARWQLLNERMTATRLPYVAYFHYVALTRFVGQFTSMLAMEFVGRGAGLRAAGSKQGLGRLVTPVLLERLLDLVLPVVMLGWVIVVERTALSEHAWSSLLVLTMVFAVGVVPLIGPLAKFAIAVYVRLRRWRGAQLEPEPEPIEITRSTAAWVSAHSLGRYATILLQFFGMGAAAGAITDFGAVLRAFPVQQLSAVIAVTPGGLGIQDIGWAGAFHWLGENDASIALFLLALRVLVPVNFGLLSLLTLPLAGRRPHTPVQEENA